MSVSGRQISDALKLTLLLTGTLGFLIGRLVCHRIPRVLEAGRTFLVIGANMANQLTASGVGVMTAANTASRKMAIRQ